MPGLTQPSDSLDKHMHALRADLVFQAGQITQTYEATLSTLLTQQIRVSERNPFTNE